jgi:hypothetical protein
MVMSPAAADITTYRWSRAQVLRSVGLGVVALGLMWLVIGAASAWRGEVGSVLSVPAAAVTGLGLGVAIWLVVRPPRVLALSPTGYRISHLRGCGVPAADWSDVESVETRLATGGPAIVVELSGGRTSLVPLSLLGLRAGEAQREMHNRLNSAFGYRRLRDKAQSGLVTGSSRAEKPPLGASDTDS